MRTFIEFVRTTIIGGVLFLIPISLGLVFLRHAFDFVHKLAVPITRFISIDRVGGIFIDDIVTVTALSLLAFVLGLLARTTLGARISGRLEKLVLHRMPQYTLLKNLGGNVDAEYHIAVALVHFSDRCFIGFVMEALDNGLLVVFVPSAPSSSSGSIYYLNSDRVQCIDIKLSEAMECIRRLGVNSKELLRLIEFKFIPS